MPLGHGIVASVHPTHGHLPGFHSEDLRGRWWAHGFFVCITKEWVGLVAHAG